MCIFEYDKQCGYQEPDIKFKLQQNFINSTNIYKENNKNTRHDNK